MSMNLAPQTFEAKTEYFEAGTDIPIMTAGKIAAAAIKAHQVVKISAENGKVSPIAAAGDTGIYGIAYEDAAAEETAVVALTGEFFADALVLPGSVKPENVELALRNIGIFLK